ncbi:hypothetical protein F5880DRAFT_1490136, partial [Lentinula raphanica]
RQISFKIIYSTTDLLPKWREHIGKTKFKGQVLPRDVATRWNSTYDMLAAFLEMKEPVTAFLDRSSHKLTDYVLDDEEWEAVEGLVSILKDATTFFSTKSPSVATVIPAMDIIDETLASGIIDRTNLPAPVRHALSLGKKTMNKYYQLTDDSYIYRMAIGMYGCLLVIILLISPLCSSSPVSQARLLHQSQMAANVDRHC